MFLDDFSQAVEDGLQPLRQRAIRRLDAAAGDIDQLFTALVEDAKAGNA